MNSKDNENKLSRDRLLAKLENEYKESETLQWFIEVEILRLTSKGKLSYDELKELAKISKDRLTENN